ncbi:MAG TPA: hypothetical protein VNJ01_01400 [Bacteriovoracaceae bacterium]|nr:hypothetical protein [Bacteriovoracaceae bacterium]
MKYFLVGLLALSLNFTVGAQTRVFPVQLNLSSKLTDNRGMPFFERNNTLSYNVEYDGVISLRAQIGKATKTLKFFTGFNPAGEAHVTTITPPEFEKQLSPYLSLETINHIAKSLDIQSSDLKILGLGSGKKLFPEGEGETFFIIVESKRLRRIRQAIYLEYLRNGGPRSGVLAFKPERFYPHITVGYTVKDIHEDDGLLKDIKHSLDSRFILVELGR